MIFGALEESMIIQVLKSEFFLIFDLPKNKSHENIEIKLTLPLMA